LLAITFDVFIATIIIILFLSQYCTVTEHDFQTCGEENVECGRDEVLGTELVLLCQNHPIF
jgi:hypothetical protein